MGRHTPGHFDNVFLNKVKEACIHVLDQLNEANEIEQAFDLCPSISRRNRVILSFLRDADQANDATSSSSTTNASASLSGSPPLGILRPSTSIRPSREPSLGTDSIASLSAQRRRRAREMQYVRDPIGSNDDSDSQATVAGPSSTSSHAHLDPAWARNPNMSQPDYTFEQFAEHLDPTDKLLKRSFEIVIKETARQALAKKRDPNYDPANSSGRPFADPAASLRSVIASSRSVSSHGADRPRYGSRQAAWSRIQAADPYWNASDPNVRTASLDRTYQLLRSLRSSTRTLNSQPDTGLQPSNAPLTDSDRPPRRTLRDLMLTTATGRLGSFQAPLPSTWSPSSSLTSRTTQPLTSATHLPIRVARAAPNWDADSSSSSPDGLVPQLAQRRSAARPNSAVALSQQAINARLAEAARRNAEAARTIVDAERLRSSQFIRTSIESLRASLFQLHMDLTGTQLQQLDRSRPSQTQENASSPSAQSDLCASYALVMDTIELFDDTLRRLSCLVSNTSRETDQDASSTAQTVDPQRHADSSQMRTSLWRARNLMLLSSMTRRPDLSENAASTGESDAAASHEAELRAHRHLLATIEESHWSRADARPPSAGSIRAWRRKLAAWYYLDRDRSCYPDAPHSNSQPEDVYARWHPDLELPYSLDDEIVAPTTSGSASSRPYPITDPQAAWAYVRSHDAALANDLNQDDEVRAALEAGSVATALQQVLRLHNENADTAAPSASAATEAAVASSTGTAEELHTMQLAHATVEDADPDVSLTRTTSLSRRGAVRGLPLSNFDTSSIRSARSSLSLRRPRSEVDLAGDLSAGMRERQRNAQEDNDAIEEDIVETGIEIGTVPHSPVRESASATSGTSSLQPPSDRPRTGRSGSFTFITTPAAVLRSRQRSASRSQDGPRSESPAAAPAVEEGDSEAEEYIDLDLDLGMAGDDAFDFDLVDFLRSESRRARRQDDDEDELETDSMFASSSPPPRLRDSRHQNADADASQDDADSSSPTGIRVFISGSGASTPAEARQATFEAYAERARLLERRRRMERQRQVQDDDDAREGGGNGSEEHSSEGRRRRRGRQIGETSGNSGENADRRNSLPFPRSSER
ncbi:uncharacterized protein UBRO_08035 [Ustilago bromivora]|uniref:Uncharacterized protein n=1 Tax=Ustilago bromivora TaxID=307758 RepID=A0A1K0HCG2_9BASI|nr:uncharacterized protein UBRO_08035 [Ustilago bromivora]SYW76189.1 uncharacterized protein UBRO2_01260 [Ustilago bromivora]